MNQDLPFACPKRRTAASEEAIGAASFILSLRAQGIRDTALLRAMELVPREVFAPRRFTDLARTDVALPLPCGQTMTGAGARSRPCCWRSACSPASACWRWAPAAAT